MKRSNGRNFSNRLLGAVLDSLRLARERLVRDEAGQASQHTD
jgi:hypothetical protein